MSHKEIHGAGYKGKGHYRGDRFQMGCQERFQGVTGEKPDQIGTGTGQKKPGGHREQVYEAVGVWQDKEGIAAEIEEKDYAAPFLDKGYTKIMKYGICFCEKTCMVEVEK